MAGTDQTKAARLGGPAIVLVDPQLGENIGMVARAMLNCGLTDLRLVRPRDGWPNPTAVAAASGADLVLERARLFETTEAAVADLRRVYATTTRARGMLKPVLSPRRAVAEMRAAARGNSAAAVGVLFGPERSGLVNDDIALADAVLAVPLNPAFASLNLAQAVLIIGYEWFQTLSEAPARELPLGPTRPATKAELINFFGRLERLLDEAGFLHPPERRPHMVRNLRNLLQRADLTEQDLRSLHGVLSALISGRIRTKGGPPDGGGG